MVYDFEMAISNTIPTIPQLLHRNAEQHGEKLAFSSPGRWITHFELQARTARIACHLETAGVTKESHVVILLDRCVEAVESILAVTRAGATAVPLDPRCSQAELATILDDVWSDGSRWLVTNSAGAKQAHGVNASQKITIWSSDSANAELNVLPYESLLANDVVDTSSPPDDLAGTEKAFLHYTSGSTGNKPKGVVSSQQAWIRSTLFSMTTDLNAHSNDRILCPLPITHAYGFSSGVIVTLCSGASLHMTGDQSLAQNLARDAYTIILGVPTTYSELISLESVENSLSSVRLCISGGAPASPALNAQVEKKLGLPILNHYGATETCGAITVCRLNRPFAQGSSGSIIPGREVRIVYPTTAEDVSLGEEGEIWIRSASLLMHYHNGSESPFVDGWYRSGDIGRFDEQGNLIITGRLKETILRGGHNIHPAEIESVLNACPGVKESVVVASPHEVFGEVPIALLVGEADCLALQDLVVACRKALPNYKVPVGFFEIDSVPRTRGGKPRRRAAASLPRRRLTAGSLTPAAIEAAIIDEFGHARGLPTGATIDPMTPFGDMGMNSMVGIVVRDRLVSLTGIELPIALLFDHSTPKDLGEYIYRKLSGEVPAQVFQNGAPQQIASVADEPIAIVSMSCRYPGGITCPEDLWSVLEAGIDVTSDFPSDRGWDIDALYDPDPDMPGTTTTRRGGFLHNMADFDAGLFGMSPREAEATDPQQRLLLESTWELLERGGIAPSSLKGSDTGVYVGVMYDDYAGRFIDTRHELEAQLGLGSAASVAAGRISHSFDFQGPSLSVDTACSSSLVAVDLAVKSLRAGECPLAIAGGVTTMATPQAFVMFSKQRGLSPDGRCRSYSDDANGTAWSEGVGLLLLERLSDAQRNGHHILGLVRGIATNSDGRSSTLTAPNGAQQERSIRSALQNARFSPKDVDVIEGHGTATTLGDLIEVRSLMATYGQDRFKPVLLGSLKSNVGHTQAAAGVAGIIKMVMAMQKGIVPKSIHTSKPSRHVDWADAKIKLLKEAQPWPQSTRPRRAAVSAFGIGGTNAHVILEQGELPTKDESPAEAFGRSKIARSFPWLLSGADESPLRAQARAAKGLCRLDPSDVAFSLATTRSYLRWRAAVSAGDMDALDALSQGASHPRVHIGRVSVSRLVIMFSGQGGQFAEMFDELCGDLPMFRIELHAVCDALDQHLEKPLLETLRTSPELIDRTDITQAAVFAFQVALYRTLQHFGIEPAYLVGHSIGEITAAHVSGILTVEDAAKLVATRGELMSTVQKGAMTSIGTSEAELIEYLQTLNIPEETPVLAAVNSERSVVVSGSFSAIEKVEKDFKSRGRRTKRLRISHACHLPHMEGILPDLLDVLETIPYSSPRIPVVSTVSGRGAVGSDLRSAQYWARQVVEPVSFADAVQSAKTLGGTVFLEIGPTAALATHVEGSVSTGATVKSLIDAMVHLHVQGCDLAWSKVLEGSGAYKVDLPTYPFQRRRYWLDPPKRISSRRNIDHAFLDHVLPHPTSGQITFTGRISLKEHPCLSQHVMSGKTILPATAFAEIAIRAGTEMSLDTLQELTLLAPLDLSSGGEVDLQILVEKPNSNQEQTFTMFSRPSNAHLSQQWAEHASGILGKGSDIDKFGEAQWPNQGEVDIAASYDTLAAAGISHGPAFRCVDRLWRTAEGFIAKLVLPNSIPVSGHIIHPAILDAAMHSPLLADRTGVTARLPFRLAGVRLWPSNERVFRAVVKTINDDQLSIQIRDSRGRLVADLESVSLRAMRNRGGDLFTLEWSSIASRLNEAKFVRNEKVIRISAQRSTQRSPAEIHKAVQDILADIKDWRSASEARENHRMVVVTERATSDDPDLLCAAAWGFFRSAQSEFEGSLVLVDVDGSEGSEAALESAVSSVENVLQLRDGNALIPRLARQSHQISASQALDFSGTALITGGTGALGFVLACHLVEKYGVKNLLLVSRNGPDADNLANEDLASWDAEVIIKACDVSNYEQLERLLTSVKPPVTAVFHTAGIIDDALLDSLTPERVTNVLKPKVDGAWYLHHLLPHANPFVLFSSAAGILGNAGQANYAAGNTYLDALARHRHHRGLHGLSLAWGPWKNKSGMAGKILVNGPFLPISDQQGLELLDEALLSGQQVLVPLMLRNQVPAITRMNSSHRHNFLGSVNKRKNSVAFPSHEHPQEFEQLIRNEVADVLGYDKLPDLPFMELGVDSLTGVLIRNRITKLTGVTLPSTVLFEIDTVSALAKTVLEKLAEAKRTLATQEKPVEKQGTSCDRNNDMQLSMISQQLCLSDRFNDALAMLAIASMTLPVFDASEVDKHTTSLRQLRSGTNSIVSMVCLPDFFPSPSNNSVFGALSSFMEDDLSVYDISYPTDIVPDTLSTLTDLLAESISNSLAGWKIILIGYSAGGIIAHALAQTLKDTIAGLILLDTYPVTENIPDWQASLPGKKIIEAQGLYHDSALVTMGHYIRITQGYKIERTAAPTLFIRASQPVPEMKGCEWKAAWPDTDYVVEVPGDHMSMVRERARSTAEDICRWVKSVLCE